uniref:(northern house mosquito) hypothetical protein n=1 Tax=Culex pipiens TaxID=7175 RepID=A0A8D8KXG8_CULPI
MPSSDLEPKTDITSNPNQHVDPAARLHRDVLHGHRDRNGPWRNSPRVGLLHPGSLNAAGGHLLGWQVGSDRHRWVRGGRHHDDCVPPEAGGQRTDRSLDCGRSDARDLGQGTGTR